MPPIEAPTDDCADATLDDPPPLGLRDVRRFLAATACAWLAVRCLSLERMVSRVGRRRARHAPSDSSPFALAAGRAPQSAELASAKRCAASYERLQPLAFTARDACLFQSYAFLDFAARYGLYPAWVFGVQTAPFAAHCWVQLGPLVLNDTAEHAAAFTPIMVA